MRLLLVRHGLTDFNSNRRFAGFSDIEMSPAGFKQVEKLRDRLAGDKVDAIYCSDLKRAVATARVLAGERGVDVIPCPELREINYGQAEGLTFDEIKRTYPEVAELITNFNLKLKFPGGEGFEEFIGRTSQFLQRLTKHDASQTVLVVSHGGPLRVLVCRLLGIHLECWWQIRVDNASLSILDLQPRGAIINFLNDTYHLIV